MNNNGLLTGTGFSVAKCLFISTQLLQKGVITLCFNPAKGLKWVEIRANRKIFGKPKTL